MTACTPSFQWCHFRDVKPTLTPLMGCNKVPAGANLDNNTGAGLACGDR